MNECLYCYHELPELPDAEEAPLPKSDQEWLAESEHHTAECKWLLTRSFTLPEENQP